MARMQLFFPVRDLSGNQIAGAKVYLFAAGTATVADPPTGTAISGAIYTTRTGGTTTTSPLTSDASGIAQVWLETAQALDVVTTDATNTAVYAGTARLYDFAPFLRVFDASGDVEAHEADPTGAHAASAVSFTPTGTVAATDVQAAIAEVASEAGSGNAKLAEENTFTEDNYFVGDVTVDLNPLNDGGGGSIGGRAYGDTAVGFALTATRARGTQASPTTPQADDFLLNLGTMAYDDGSYRSTATIRYAVEAGTPDATVPSRLEFWTSDDQDMLQRLQIDTAGKVWFTGHSGVTVLKDTNLYRASAGVLQTDNAFVIDGSADVPQFSVTAHSTQTAPIAKIEYSNANDLFAAYDVAGTGFVNYTGNAAGMAVNEFGYGDNATAPSFSAGKARGTQTAPTDVADADGLIQMNFQGFWSSAFRTAASITAFADGTPSGTRVPGRIIFSTATTAANATERLRLDSVGDLYRTGTATTTYGLRTRNSTSAANDHWHVRIDGLQEWGAGGASAVDTNLYRSAAGLLKTDHQFVAADGLTGKYLSGAGKTSVVDGDFTVTPADGTLAVVRNTSDSKVRLFARANGAWEGVEVS